jgi:hypothetical protein
MMHDDEKCRNSLLHRRNKLLRLHPGAAEKRTAAFADEVELDQNRVMRRGFRNG